MCDQVDPIRERQVTLGRRPTRVLEIGEPGQPGILLLHGMWGTADRWRPVLRCLAKLGRFHAIAIDLPRDLVLAGPPVDTPAGAPESVVESLADVAQVAACALFGGQQITIVGHSLMGTAAAALARRREVPVERFILVGPTTRERPLPMRIGRIIPERLALRSIGALSDDRRQRFFFFVHHAFSGDIDGARSVATEMRDRTVAQWCVQAAHVLLGEVPSFDLGGIRYPVEFVWGGLDRIAPPRAAKLVRARRPDLITQVVENWGHSPHWAHPAGFCAFLVSRLNEPPAPVRQRRERGRSRYQVLVGASITLSLAVAAAAAATYGRASARRRSEQSSQD